MDAPNKRVPATVCGVAPLCLMAASLLSTTGVSAEGVCTDGVRVFAIRNILTDQVDFRASNDS
jgi:hypothetical protein